jgi:hypothetical protein
VVVQGNDGSRFIVIRLRVGKKPGAVNGVLLHDFELFEAQLGRFF